jgi:hypothetical protein
MSTDRSRLRLRAVRLPFFFACRDLDVLTELGEHVLSEEPELVVKMGARALVHLCVEDLLGRLIIGQLSGQELVRRWIDTGPAKVSKVVVMSTPRATRLVTLAGRAPNLDDLLDVVAQLASCVVLGLEKLLTVRDAFDKTCHIHLRLGAE